jgi:hypothetical protein
MDTAAIDKAFIELIEKRGVYKELGVPPGNIRTWRYNIANNIPISTDTKLQLLQKSGWTPGKPKFTRADMISFVKFYTRASEAKKKMGFEFMLEQWEAKQG